MRRPLLAAFILFAGLVATGCGEDRSVSSAPTGPSLVLATTSTISDLQIQSDALLQEPARTAARLALAKVQSDMLFKRPSLYASSLGFAAIPLIERRLNRIPQDKVDQLVNLLCSLSTIIKPLLPPALAAIDFCKVDAAHLSNDAAFQLVTNAAGATLTTGTKKFSFNIGAGTLFDKNDVSLNAVFITVLPLSRTASTATAMPTASALDVHACPTPWDPAYAQFDCYPEYYEVSVQPSVKFNPKAALEVCQIDPSAALPQAPTAAVGARLELFSKDGNNQVSRLEPNSGSPTAAAADCAAIEHGTVIGAIDLSRQGMRNAFLKLAQLGGEGLNLFRPSPLFASNSPTHGDVGLEFLPIVGFVVGAFDPVVRVASVQVSPATAGVFLGGSVALSRQLFDKVGGAITRAASLQATTWSSSNPAVATVDPSTGVVTGVGPGTVSIIATVGSGDGVSTVAGTATVVVDPNADFRGIWNGTTTFAGATQGQPVTVVITNQTGNTVEGEYRVALVGQTVAYNQTRYFTSSVASGWNLQFAVDPFTSPYSTATKIENSVTLTGNLLSGTTIRTRAVTGGFTTDTWSLSLSRSDVATVQPPPMLVAGSILGSRTSTTSATGPRGSLIPIEGIPIQ